MNGNTVYYFIDACSAFTILVSIASVVISLRSVRRSKESLAVVRASNNAMEAASRRMGGGI